MLSGGGVRGAYAAGAVLGVAEIGAKIGMQQSPFQIFGGASVGALNCAFLASHAQKQDCGAQKLCDIWRSITIERFLQINSGALWRLISRQKRAPQPPSASTVANLPESLLNVRPLEALIRGEVAWDQLHRNVQSGVVRAFITTALHVGSGQTAIFAETACDDAFRPSRDPRRQAHRTEIDALHVLAATAIPTLFPPRRIGTGYYCDGGVRLNTPLAPVIRAGARKLAVVLLSQEAPIPPPSDGTTHPGPIHHEPEPTPRRRATLAEMQEREARMHDPVFLAGKLLNSLLLDPVLYDLQVLERYNRWVELLDDTLTPKARARIDAAMLEARGNSYQRVQTLVLRPSQDIARMASDYAKRKRHTWKLGRMARMVVDWATDGDQENSEADFAAFVLYDGQLAAELIELGHSDVMARSDEIADFLGHNSE